MKFTIAQETMGIALAIVGRAVSKKNTIPVLKGVHVHADAALGRVVLRATDMEKALEVPVPAQVETGGAIVLPAQMLVDLVHRIPAHDLTLEADMRNFTATIRWGKSSEYKLHGFASDQFPTMPDVPAEAQKISVKQALLKDLIDKTSFAAGQDESKPWLTGALFKLKDGILSALTTDGVRIANSEMPVENPGAIAFTVIVPSPSLDALDRVLSVENDAMINITLIPGGNQVLFDTGKVTMLSRLLEGQYPDVMRLVPQSYSAKASIQQFEPNAEMEKTNLLEAIERAMLLAKDGALKLSFTQGLVKLTSNTPEVGQIYEEVPVKYEGEPIDVGFNGKFLTDWIKKFIAHGFEFELSGPRNPARLRAGSCVYVVLPLISF